jgi:hypothetical protein
VKKLVIAVLTTAALAGASPAAAHFVVVDPAGNGDGTMQHVGQLPPEHNSCAGHLTASQNEQSGAVTFLGPAVC